MTKIVSARVAMLTFAIAAMLMATNDEKTANGEILRAALADLLGGKAE